MYNIVPRGRVTPYQKASTRQQDINDLIINKFDHRDIIIQYVLKNL